MRALRWCMSAAGAAAVIGTCTTGVLLVHADGNQAVPSVRMDQRPARIAPTTTAAAADGPRSSAERFRDGRYQVIGKYLTPGGDESIGVTVDVAADVVIAVQVRSDALSPTALQFQDQFGQHIGAPVVGRELSSVSVSRVSGASLTSVGFNDAMNRIRSEAGR